MSRGGNSKIRIIAIPGRTDFDECESLVGGRKAARSGRTAPWRSTPRLACRPGQRLGDPDFQLSCWAGLSRHARIVTLLRDHLPADAVVEQNSTLARRAGR
jgi:hypothetical protein